MYFRAMKKNSLLNEAATWPLFLSLSMESFPNNFRSVMSSYGFDIITLVMLPCQQAVRS